MLSSENKSRKEQVSVRMRRNWDPCAFAGVNVNVVAAVGNRREVPQRIKAGVPVRSRDSFFFF